MDLAVPVAVSKDSHCLWAASCNGTFSGPSNVSGRHVKETDVKIGYSFCPTDIGGTPMHVQLHLQIAEK